MNENCPKNDLRVTKTYNVLLESLRRLLRRRSFKKLTVHDICTEAQISRATFYTHFRDKYDLLSYWLGTLRAEPADAGLYERVEDAVNRLVLNDRRIVRNVLEDADGETSMIVFDFIASLLDIYPENAGAEQEYVVLSNMCAGGIISYINWHLRRKFPPGLPVMNEHFYKAIKAFVDFKKNSGS